ncbi:hypothetical protein [Desulfonatronospira sp.]|uniref:hypothetical protein n=1 Tax=Desulfonatronospira sp. TaxID=1962951 RepID=UPI0025C55CD9|nr:hypothetical protein [Desulfonatronospira sp.]
MNYQEKMKSVVRNYEMNPLQLFLVGWRLIVSEIRWNAIRLFRQWEIHQLKKRLDHEKQRLGEAISSRTSRQQDSVNLKDPEMELVLGQVSFLEEEIANLENELQVKRKAFLDNRRSRYLGEQD